MEGVALRMGGSVGPWRVARGEWRGEQEAGRGGVLGVRGPDVSGGVGWG